MESSSALDGALDCFLLVDEEEEEEGSLGGIDGYGYGYGYVAAGQAAHVSITSHHRRPMAG